MNHLSIDKKKLKKKKTSNNQQENPIQKKTNK